jgi:catechol 2,3-dioxygenase-like lactoylglutathione lyase family enzyme
MGVESDARRITLCLGDDIIELLEFNKSGAPYPTNSESSSLVFQHFAIVTDDMAEAWLTLLGIDGWSRITAGGPQRLPDRAGGVTAFKFRDPDGHPLELLSFPRDNTPPKWRRSNGDRPCLGIDHSAISVSDTAVSTRFYTAHGLTVSGHSHNTGIEQDRLDGLVDAAVDVTALSPALSTPHVELLCYENATSPETLRLNSNDIAATRLVFEAHGQVVPARLTDPDGHHLAILPQSELLRTA